MTVLRASEYQKGNLHGQRRGNHIIEFTQDANGEWIIGKGILDNPHFSDLRSKLVRLTEIEYAPPIEENETDEP